MEKKWINLVFIIDESGSMYSSQQDVVGGFKKMIEEQRKVKDGKLTVSLFTFNNKVNKKYIGVDVNEIDDFEYYPGGMTALYDAACESIDNVGKWLYEKDKNGEEMPSKTIVCIMTDGEENSSVKYNLKDIRERLERQEKVYDWAFVYLGNDLSDAKDVNLLGDSVKYRGFTTKKKFYNNYDIISTGLTAYRCAATLSDASLALNKSLTESVNTLNTEYKADTGIDLTDNNVNGSV